MNSGKHPWLAGVLVGALIILLPITGAWGVTPLSNLILKPQDGFTELLVPDAGRLLCGHASEEAANGLPFRIVLDFCDADHALGQKAFDALPPTVISRIRTSQYAQTPQKIVRIVLDMRKSVTYTVNTGNNTVTVRVVDPGRAPFAVWEANPGTRSTLASKTDATTAAKPAVATPPVISNPQHASVKSETKTTAPSQTVVTTAGATKSATESSANTVAQHPVGPNASATKTGPPAPAVGSENKPARQPSGATIVSAPVSDQSKVVANESSKPAAPDKPATTVASMSPSGSVDAKNTKATSTPMTPAATPQTIPSAGSAVTTGASAVSGETHPSDSYFPPKRPLVLAPEYLYADDQTAQIPSTGQEKVPVAQVSMEPIGPQTPAVGRDGASTASATVTGSSMLASTTTSPIMNKPANTGKPGDTASVAGSTAQGPETLFERLRSKFFSEQTPPRPYTSVDFPGAEVFTVDSQAANVYGPPSPPIMLSREELLAKVREAAQLAGVQPGDLADEEGSASVGSSPSRNVIIYDDMGRRDPFAPLVKGLRSGFISDQLPSVENLRLVGVLRDDREAIALLENLEGYGYVLHVGDRVENGTVAAIEENRVLFRVQDYGWSHIVALQLTTRGVDPSKLLGAKMPTKLEYQEMTPIQEPRTNNTETPKPESAKP